MRLIWVGLVFVLAAASVSASTLPLAAESAAKRLTVAEAPNPSEFGAISEAGTKSWRQTRTAPPPPANGTQALMIWLALCLSATAAAISPSARSAVASFRRRKMLLARRRHAPLAPPGG